MTEFINIKRKNYNLIEEQKRTKKTELSGYPYWLTIDPANYCNLRCPLCPTGQRRGSRKAADLPLRRFENILDELGPYLIHIDLCNWGEPLLNESVYDMIRCAKSYSVDVKIDTNFNSLSEEGAEKLVESGLDKIILSIDGASQDTYGVYRKGGSIEKVFENIKLLLKKRDEASSRLPLVEWQFLVFRHNQHEINAARKKAFSLGVDEINFTPPYAGSLEWLTTLEPFREKHYEVVGEDIRFKSQPRGEICNWLWDGIAVNSDGSVSPCCSVEDAADDFSPGFPLSDFHKIWNGESYTAARRHIAAAAEPGSRSDNRCIRCEHWGWSNHMDVGHILERLEKNVDEPE